jgi:hypothetical protein
MSLFAASTRCGDDFWTSDDNSRHGGDGAWWLGDQTRHDPPRPGGSAMPSPANGNTRHGGDGKAYWPGDQTRHDPPRPGSSAMPSPANGNTRHGGDGRPSGDQERHMPSRSDWTDPWVDILVDAGGGGV